MQAVDGPAGRSEQVAKTGQQERNSETV